MYKVSHRDELLVNMVGITTYPNAKKGRIASLKKFRHLSNTAPLLCSSLLVLSFAACSPIAQTNTSTQTDCQLTVPVVDKHNATITIGDASWCTLNNRSNWIEYTNRTGHDLTEVSICATTLAQSGMPTGKPYCGSAALLQTGERITTPHFPLGTYGIQASASESGV